MLTILEDKNVYENHKTVGLVLKELNQAVHRMVERVVAGTVDVSVTPTQLWIIQFLSKRGDQKTYQKDLEKEFLVRRATVSGLLRRMEKAGLLVRTVADGDARSRLLELTPRAIDIHNRVENTLAQLEKELEKGIKPTERDVFMKVVAQIQDNAKNFALEKQ